VEGTQLQPSIRRIDPLRAGWVYTRAAVGRLLFPHC